MYYFNTNTNEIIYDLQLAFPHISFPDTESEYFELPSGVHLIHTHDDINPQYSEIEIVDGVYYFKHSNDDRVLQTHKSKFNINKLIVIFYNDKYFDLDSNIDNLMSVEVTGSLTMIDSKGVEMICDVEQIKMLFRQSLLEITF